MDFTNLITVDILAYLQTKFDKNICNQIFGSNSNHLYKKWVETNTNIISFLTRLDETNKFKLLHWGLLNH
jgi:hypothetical protein